MPDAAGKRADLGAAMGDAPSVAARLHGEDIIATLAELCPTARVHSVVRGPRSYSNRLWLAETNEGRLLVRVPARTADPEHVRTSVTGARLASEAGIPTVRFRAFAPHSRLGLPVVIQEYQAGENATQALRRGAARLSEVASALGDWIGRLHGVRREWFGSLAGTSGDVDWATTVASKVQAALAAVADEALPVPRARITSAFDRAISDLPHAGPASLVHGDLYFENVLVEDGRASALIDFEHAHFHDRFSDFGKLEELLFELWPGSERPFMEAYGHHFPHDDADALRRRVGVGLYELSQLAYFSRWQPELVGVYRTRLDRWLTGA